MEKRVIELEERIAFQEDTIQKLDDALADQQQQIMSLEERVRILLDQLQKLEAAIPDGSSPEDDKPPHY